MYRTRKLSAIEQDAITLYKNSDTKSIQLIARELGCSHTTINAVLFKYVNGFVQDSVMCIEKIPKKYMKILPRISKVPSYETIQQAKQETKQLGLVLLTKGK